jgi:alkylation response protein AidB-like acyl-CoA dehydrogenase
MRLGTHEQRRTHLKGIASAEVLWAEGFTEPDSGSDLASLQTRAERHGDEWILNGQKTFGTAAHRCQWMYVLARTDPDAPKHAAISCFLVPLDAPGITLRALPNMAHGRQNMTFFDNVRLPLDALVGEENRAWQQVWFHMGGERLDRGGPTPSIFQRQLALLLEPVIDYCRTTRRNGRAIIEDPVVRQTLADLVIGIEGLRMLEFERLWRFESGEASPIGPALPYLADGVYKELWPRFAQACMEVIGPLGEITRGPFAPLGGEVERFYRGSFGNHGGGTSQLKRMVMATRGLGLPR